MLCMRAMKDGSNSQRLTLKTRKTIKSTNHVKCFFFVRVYMNQVYERLTTPRIPNPKIYVHNIKYIGRNSFLYIIIINNIGILVKLNQHLPIIRDIYIYI